MLRATIALLLVCLLEHATLASVVYGGGYSVSMGLVSRSTFSTGSDSSAPEAVSYVNFKVSSDDEGDINYLAHIGKDVPYSVKLGTTHLKTAASKSSSRPWSLITILSAPKNCSSDYDSLISSFGSSDDVWSQAFLDHLVLSPGKCGGSWTSAIKSGFHAKRDQDSSSKGSGSVTVLSSSTEYAPSGPYLLLSSRSDTLYPVYRVYTDGQYAFTSGLLPKDLPANASEQVFVQSPTGGQDTFAVSAVSVPVPSRLYFAGKKTSEKPLAGLRVAIKDIYDIAGVRTGCGSRAYYAHYNDAVRNSFPVQRLLEKGAILVGKTKTSQFANGETPTADWVDQLCPFNIRGDGYQNPSSSSSGSAAAQGAYDWIDVTLGSDTGGSIRGPAGVNGILGIRPSIDAISLEGVMPLSDVQDTSGYFARDAFTFSTVGDAFYGELATSKNTEEALSSITKILVPSDFWTGSVLPSNGSSSGAVVANETAGSAASDLVGFVNTLASKLGTADMIDQGGFSARWNASGQNETLGSLSSYLNTTYPVLIGDYQYRVLAQPFIDSYSQANGGREPFINPVPIARWAFAQSLGKSAYSDALDEFRTFTSYVRESVLPSDCSTLLVYPQSRGTPSPRNRYFSAPGPPFGFSAGRISNLAGVPEIVIPISQATFNSTITKLTTDTLPVAISIVGGHNCDGQLLRLAMSLESAGITSPVKVGAATF